ncbi:MAG: glycine cleavage system protein H [Halobacteriovoraceae bacterium]|nr:glycine cleavage system protein H [Peredibacter sp.]MBJ00433.1 glycine cleavage system protein H [Halobacteriovoraceae bacterium]|tara:strand:- start:9699 stop:10085 length:387 start_codon:yes stop_codon:yes gene_type:complete
MSTIPENLYYTEEHEWISIEGDVATIGITDFAQSSLGDIVFVELPESETEFEDGDSFGVVESIKSVSDLYTPLSGSVLEKNEEVEDSPEKLNENAFGAWLVKIKMSDSSQVENLLSAQKYKAFCETNS